MVLSNLFRRLILWGSTGAIIGVIVTVLLGSVFKSGLLTNLMLAALGSMLTG
jgi:CBS-domain-containing membrane protein